MTIPRATYRLQMRAGFGFKEAAALAPYLGRLGVSHAYFSPFFKARPGSTHGYDITDHTRLNPELGTDADFAAMIAAFRRTGVGRIVDFVPNHMGVGGADNPFWLDVLEWGPESEYARWFDIDWSSTGDAGRPKLLAPVLGDHYGEALRNGALVVKLDEDGAIAIWAHDANKLPICPLSYPQILGHDNLKLDGLSDSFLDLPNWRPHIAARARWLKQELASLLRNDAEALERLQARINRLNSDWVALDRLIADQFWRAAFYRVAEDEINYRRFFNINDLAGLRIESPTVFAHAHVRVFHMLESGELDGLRIDHIDGLFDPKAYLNRLRDHVGKPFYLVVEKILAPHERLRPSWPVEGSTGYDFLNQSLALLVDASAEEEFTSTYRAFTGANAEFEDIARACKIKIMESEMASELAALTRAAVRLARQSSLTVDLTYGLLLRAIKQVIACLPVYRSYVDLEEGSSDADRHDIAWGLSRARRQDPELHPSAFDFLENILSARTAKPPTREISRNAALRFAMKFQQLSGPVMAKGVEDTAFYRYHRFLALNEVGGAPDRFGAAPAQFHKAVAQRAERWPHAMLATATHDTKRGEDTRARLAVLSECPEEWRRNVATWSRLLRARRGDIDGKAGPDKNDEYMFYQMLVGSWPTDMLDDPGPEALKAYRERLSEALIKSLREGKRHSSWVAPQAKYEADMLDLARAALGAGSNGFLANFLPFIQRLARFGAQNSLTQTLFKLTSPGVPDIYQGSELWDFNFVDPDNRRPVDYALREQALQELAPRLESIENRRPLFDTLMETWRDGRVKLATSALLLSLRGEWAEFFRTADYQPITFSGDRADWAFGYLRATEQRKLAVLVARFPALRDAEPNWRAIANLPEGLWFDHFRGCRIDSAAPLSEWLGALPFAVLSSER